MAFASAAVALLCAVAKSVSRAFSFFWLAVRARSEISRAEIAGHEFAAQALYLVRVQIPEDERQRHQEQWKSRLISWAWGDRRGECLFSRVEGAKSNIQFANFSSHQRAGGCRRHYCGRDSKLRRSRFRPIATASWVNNTESPSSGSVEKRIVERKRAAAQAPRRPAAKSRSKKATPVSAS